jgi:hypothetical protein
VSLLIEHRFRGPTESANGGYTCGSVSAALGLPLGPAEVTLHYPPPLDVPLPLTRDDGDIAMHHGDQLVASGRAAPLALTIPDPVSFTEARAAAERCPWLHDHPYPECFVCGIDRAPGDGLLIHPGAVTGRRVAAAPWVPDESVAERGIVRPAVVWASVDCPSLFGWGCFEEWEGRMLLGRLTVEVHRQPRVGERCVAMGWALGRDGRKHHTAAALHTAEGELLAASRALWIVLR